VSQATAPAPASMPKARSATQEKLLMGLAQFGGTPVAKTSVPFMSTGLTQADKDAVNTVLDSGMLRAAKKCEELEQRWATLTGAKHALTCANGTCALQLAYEPLIKPGDDVLVPAWSYIATASMLVARGARPIFVDALPDTYQIDVRDASRKITRNTTAIAATHLYGCPVDINAVQALADKHSLMVVYDAAQAHLATYNGRPLGEFGDAVTYSLYATKNLATGEGGIITCNDDGLAREIALLRSHGETEKYLHEQVGYNYRLNDMAGAIGCSRLDRLEEQTNQRRENAARYHKMITKIEGLKPPLVTNGSDPAWHLYVCQLELARFTCTRDEFCAALKAEGVPTAVHYPRSLPNQPAFAEYNENDTPVADNLSRKVFALPMHHDLSDEHFRVVEEALTKVVHAFGA
jgi:perosamine synthetase